MNQFRLFHYFLNTVGNRHIRGRRLRKWNVMGNFRFTSCSEVADGKQSTPRGGALFYEIYLLFDGLNEKKRRMLFDDWTI